MRPSPRTPSVLPKTSTPRKRERCHSPFLTEKHACGMLRERAIIRLMVCSAAEIMLPSGAFMTMVPFAVAASTSMLSTPTPARPMTFRFDASITSFNFCTAPDDESVVVTDKAGQLFRKKIGHYVDVVFCLKQIDARLR